MEAPKIPEELQQQLTKALQDLSIYIHDQGVQQVLISIQHVSDALARQGSTAITIMGGGIHIKKDAAANSPKNKEEVESVIADLMKKAKDKQKNTTSDAKPVLGPDPAPKNPNEKK